MGPAELLALGLLSVALSPPGAGGFMMQLSTECPLSQEGKVLWANYTITFNKSPLLCYSHEQGRFEPCDFGIFSQINLTQWLAKLLNNQTSLLAAMTPVPEDCQEQIRPLWGQTGRRMVSPNVRIAPVTPVNTAAPIMLACYVWGFYPPDITVTWLKNGVAVKDSPLPQVLPSGDWTYRTQLTLPVSPQSGDTYTCHVEHASRSQSFTQDWEPGLSPTLRVKVGVSVAVLALGLAFFITGIVCWKRMPAAAGYAPISGNVYPAGST